MEKEIYAISFESTHYAIMVEKILKSRFKIYMIPTPREITASCGLSIKFAPEDIELIIQELENNNIDMSKMGIYRVKRSGAEKTAEKII